MSRTLPPAYNGAQWLAEHLIFPLVGFLLALPAAFGDQRRGAAAPASSATRCWRGSGSSPTGSSSGTSR